MHVYIHTCNDLKIRYNYITKTIKNINNKIDKYSYKYKDSEYK